MSGCRIRQLRQSQTKGQMVFSLLPVVTAATAPKFFCFIPLDFLGSIKDPVLHFCTAAQTPFGRSITDPMLGLPVELSL